MGSKSTVIMKNKDSFKPKRVFFRFFETPEVGIIAIFVLLKNENKLEIVAHDISFNSVSP